MESLIGPAIINIGFSRYEDLDNWLTLLQPTTMMMVGDFWEGFVDYPATDMIYRQIKPRDDDLHRNVAEAEDWLRLVSGYPEQVIHTLGNELPPGDPEMWEFVYQALKLAVRHRIRTVAFNFSVTMPQYDDFFVSPRVRDCLDIIGDNPHLLSVGMHLYKNAHLQGEAWLDLSHNKILDAICDEWGLPYVNKYVTECFWDGPGFRGIWEAYMNLPGETGESLAEQMVTAIEENWLYDPTILGVVPFITDQGNVDMWDDFSFRSFPEVLAYFYKNLARLDVHNRRILSNKGCFSWVKS